MMRAQRLTAAPGMGSPPRMFAVVFEPGDEPVAGLEAFAREAGVDAARLTAIGAFEHAVVGWFDLDARNYRRIEVSEQVELLSLVGDITLADPTGSEPRIHAHVVLGRRDGSTVGGHLLEARVRPTLEVVVSDAPATLRRRHDPSTGLALIDLEGSTGTPGPTDANRQ
jgi:uncharacterized protein